MKPTFAAAVAFAALLSGASLRAQNPVNARVPPPPPPAEPVFDPLRAEKNIEVGLYYLKKHNYDAAIERFQEAAKSKPNFARPYQLLGETYEKKGMKAEAVKSYESFLKILPSSPDAGKIRKRIAKLNREIESKARRRSG